MGHDQYRYAIVTWTYDFQVTRTQNFLTTESTHHADGTTTNEQSNKFQQVTRREPDGGEPFQDFWQKTNWAPCAENERGHVFLSRWYDQVARPEAERRIRDRIEKLNKRNADAQEQWRQTHMANQLAGKTGVNPQPRDVVYAAFDGRKLHSGKVEPRSQEPAEDDGQKISWLPQKRR